MIVFLIIILLILAIFIVRFRTVIFNPISCIVSAACDLFNYFRFCGWNAVPRGEITIYTGMFGRGKTLSMVHKVTRLYRKFEGRSYKGKKNKFIILSNIEFVNIPYVTFNSMNQFVDLCDQVNSGNYPDCDLYNYCIVLCIDEINSIFNNRSFKDNFNPQTITSLMQIRKVNTQIYCTAQKFKMVDLIWRTVCTYVVECNKLWRLHKEVYFDAFDYENIENPDMLRPVRKIGWFVRNKDYAAYDTFKFATYISKEVKANNFVSEQSTIDCLGSVSQVSHNLNHKFKKIMNKSSH